MNFAPRSYVRSPLAGVAGLFVDMMMQIAFVMIIFLGLQLQRTPDTTELAAVSLRASDSSREAIAATVTVTEAGVYLDRQLLTGGLEEMSAWLEQMDSEDAGFVALCIVRVPIEQFWATVRAVEAASDRDVRHVCTN